MYTIQMIANIMDGMKEDGLCGKKRESYSG